MITLPNDFVGNIASSTTDQLGTFIPLVTLVIGLLLAGVVLEMIIGAVRHK